jgi:3-hydroxyisobutyrate dehydrogenase-like beta-hydroxyacid dehydrogenase
VPSIGLVGIGLLGSALAERLLAAGWQVLGFDLDAERRRALTAAGGAAAETSADVLARCDTIVLCLPDSRVVRAVIDEAGENLRAGQLLIDTSTGDPEDTAALAAELAARQVDYLDATIAGSSAVVRQGEALVMAGAAPAAFQRARPILQALAPAVFHVGAAGSGSRTKLVVNLVLGLNRAALAEGLALARALGLELPATLEILRAGAAYSAVMDAKGEKMLAGNFTPQARLAQHLKDVRLILEAAKRTALELPLSSIHRQLLERAVSLGYGEADNSAILRAYDPPGDGPDFA